MEVSAQQRNPITASSCLPHTLHECLDCSDCLHLYANPVDTSWRLTVQVKCHRGKAKNICWLASVTDDLYHKLLPAFTWSVQNTAVLITRLFSFSVSSHLIIMLQCVTYSACGAKSQPESPEGGESQGKKETSPYWRTAV